MCRVAIDHYVNIIPRKCILSLIILKKQWQIYSDLKNHRWLHACSFKKINKIIDTETKLVKR